MQIIFASAKIEKPWREPSTITTAAPRLHGTDLRSFEVQKRLPIAAGRVEHAKAIPPALRGSTLDAKWGMPSRRVESVHRAWRSCHGVPAAGRECSCALNAMLKIVRSAPPPEALQLVAAARGDPACP